MFADDTSLRVISVDYTLAPHSKYDRTTDQVVAVFKALLESGHQMGDILAYGDSSGGGLMASSILKARDKKMGLPRAAVLVSPWLDVTPVGDTEVTLKAADANALYERQGKNAAAAYADPEHQRDPYASPVYGNFSTGFPPTLIQGGTKETLLSGFIRMYQALDEAGIPVKLDIYEGMPHNFQSRIPDAPESIVARKKQAAFVREHFS
jgi:acetyl esterase/lipase